MSWTWKNRRTGPALWSLAAASLLLGLGSAAVAVPRADASAAARRPLILSIAAKAPGGTHPVAIGVRVVITVRVQGATSCTFLAQHTPASSLYLVRTVSCLSGFARVSMPAVNNPERLEQTLAYKVVVRGRGGTAKQQLTVVAAAKRAATPVPAPTPTPAPSPTPAPPPAASPTPTSPVLDYSPNWSGYWLGGGPFTAVSGTFNVPNLHATPTETTVAEWVGIDGATNSSLIQAGALERYDPTTSLVHVFAWWEILPAPATPIAMTVSPGDQIDVTITQLAGTLWQISLDDQTSGRRFTTNQTYTGPGASAEWIVEAPTSASTGALEDFGDYVPDVTFSGLGITGPQSSIGEVILSSGGAQLSVPSALTANGFSVAYGDAAPAAP